ncbi:MAG: hypothetical protein ABI927_06455 [Gaiellaceae bacterium]
MRLRLALVALLGLAVAGGLAATQATASEAITDTNLRSMTLAVNTKGEALLTYTRANGTVRHILAYGAINANAPVDSSVRQVRFKWDYAGGWGKYRNATYWKTFRNACQPYDGPALPYVVAGCKAPDGTYWALQSWQRLLPLLGLDAWKPDQLAYETHLSHWSGLLPQLEAYAHWTYGGQWQGIFGQLTYLGQPVHGFSSTREGNPRDRYGRNIFLDTLNSAYGSGWKRESGILVHTPTGTFCHSFVPQKPFPGYPSNAIRPAAPGERYRITVMGPGVTPVVSVEIPGLTASDRQSSGSMDAVWDRVMAGDARCASER